MTNKEKQLLLKDLCARLPYKVRIERTYVDYPTVLREDDLISWKLDEINIKPYLRPMSSMTEEEEIECDKTPMKYLGDFYCEKHLDYHNLIEKGLALEALEGMYKTE